MTGTYVGARTPRAGTVKVGVVTRAAVGRNAVPLPQADLIASYSPTDDLSLHLRAMLTSLGIEALVRARVVHTGRLHVALAPSVGVAYWPASKGEEEDPSYVSLGASANVLARLSVLASIDLGGGDLDLAAFGGVSRIVECAVPAGDDAPYAVFNYETQGVVTIGGAAIGVTVPSSSGTVRPGIEWMRFAGHQDVWTATLTWER